LRLRPQSSSVMPRMALVLALVFLTGCAHEMGGGAGRPSAGASRPTRVVLPNGVVLIAQEHRASDVVALQLWMRVGGRDETADELAYMPHPYGRPILGTPELIGALTRARLAAYYKKFYVPRDMVLVVVGAVKPADVQEAALATFGRLASPPPPRPPNPSAPPLAGGRRDDVRRSEQ